MLRRSWGHWEGKLFFASHGDVKVRMCGSAREPHAASLALAKQLPDHYPSFLPDLQDRFFEHYEIYLEAHRSGDLPAGDFPRIDTAADVWAHVAIDHELIEPVDGVLLIEIAYESRWDPEHDLGVRIREWRLSEVAGSL